MFPSRKAREPQVAAQMGNTLVSAAVKNPFPGSREDVPPGRAPGGPALAWLHKPVAQGTGRGSFACRPDGELLALLRSLHESGRHLCSHISPGGLPGPGTDWDCSRLAPCSLLLLRSLSRGTVSRGGACGGAATVPVMFPGSACPVASGTRAGPGGALGSCSRHAATVNVSSAHAALQLEVQVQGQLGC